ncbi:MAG: DUF1697 domain-containing protein [Verrucomicrobiales bacterium]|nr:DUF1697 domain-containing protein [Verrucomicrobiales bacterium]
MDKYVAFLRGINVGGHKPVKMDELRKAFEALGFQKVKTLLASGNVLFDTPKAKPLSLTRSIEAKLEEAFGHKIDVLLRSIGEIKALADSRPFQKIKVTPQTRLYVTFLSEKPKSDLKVPHESADKNFTILRVSNSEVCSVLTLSLKGRTVDLMDVLEKVFGKNVTTRNWNTITKILSAAQAVNPST